MGRRAPDDTEHRRGAPAADLLVRPLLARAEGIWGQVENRRADRPAVARAVVPQIDADAVAERRELREPVEVPTAVAPRVRPRELQRLPPIGLDLDRDALLLGALERLAREVPAIEKQRVRRELQIVVRPVVVLRHGFVAAVAALLHPRDESCEPCLDRAIVVRRPRTARLEQPHGIHDASEGAGLDQPDAAPGVDAGNELRVLQVRVHARRGIQKPRAQQRRRLRRVAFFRTCPAEAGLRRRRSDIERERQRVNAVRHSVEGAVIGDLVQLRVALAVAADVRKAVRTFRIGPEVRRLARVVVFVAARRRHRLVDDGERTRGERFVGVRAQRLPCVGDGRIVDADPLADRLDTCGIEEEHARRLGGARQRRDLRRRNNGHDDDRGRRGCELANRTHPRRARSSRDHPARQNWSRRLN